MGGDAAPRACSPECTPDTDGSGASRDMPTAVPRVPFQGRLCGLLHVSLHSRPSGAPPASLTHMLKALGSAAPALRGLAVAGFQCTRVPDGVAALPQLRLLSLPRNGITAVPEGLAAALPRLQWLGLAHNNLPRVPAAALVGWGSLRGCNLRHNRIGAVPVGEAGAVVPPGNRCVRARRVWVRAVTRALRTAPA